VAPRVHPRRDSGPVSTLSGVKAGHTGAFAGGCIAVALLFAACGGGGGNSAADQSYVAAVHLGASDIATFRTDQQLIRIGRAACDAFRAGASYQEIADRMGLLEGKNPLPSQDLGVVVTSAVDAFCPQFRSQV